MHLKESLPQHRSCKQYFGNKQTTVQICFNKTTLYMCSYIEQRLMVMVYSKQCCELGKLNSQQQCEALLNESWTKIHKMGVLFLHHTRGTIYFKEIQKIKQREYVRTDIQRVGRIQELAATGVGRGNISLWFFIHKTLQRLNLQQMAVFFSLI